MSNEIEKFDPSKLMDGVRDRIKATFVSLIPDDQWEKLVRNESEKFFKKTDQRRSYETCSDFESTCNKVLRDLATEKVIEIMKTYSGGVWVDAELHANEQLLELLTQNAPKIFAKVFGNMVQGAINGMQQGRY